MKLWLDDVRPPPEGYIPARSVEEAIYIMNFWRMNPSTGECEFPYMDDFEACSLDHDLGGKPEDDGIYFIDWMTANNVWPKEKPVVHSMNPVGRQRMQVAIDRYWPGEE